MKSFKVEIFNVQHIKRLTFNVDLSKNQLMCIVGKNGVGKTTLVRSIKNLTSADTFIKTASPHIFENNSRILYTIDEKKYDFKYDPKQEVIDTKSIIDSVIKKSIYAELPIPHGERFNHFQKLGDIDEELRTNISLQKYKKPDELIDFLFCIYNSNRFDNLKEISVKNKKYYFILKEKDFYIREDYLSSGEHFIINLYKIIQSKCKLIVIDEIDISLDASAQVNLINKLREFCKTYQVNIVFTTHSLALMKTLGDSELHYMENDKLEVSIENKSYNYVKSLLFGFKGWDKYILTEDDVLEAYLTHLLSQEKKLNFSKYKIIYIGGGTNTVDLMKRNEEYQFFSSSENVISVLDGDQEKLRYCKNNKKIFHIPFESVEKQLKEHYDKEGKDGLKDIGEFEKVKEKEKAKKLYKSFTKEEFKKESRRKESIMSPQEIFDFINERKQDEVERFKSELIVFLSPKFISYNKASHTGDTPFSLQSRAPLSSSRMMTLRLFFKKRLGILRGKFRK